MAIENKTVQYKRTLKGSVGAGVGSLVGAKGRRYYILDHRDSSKYYRAGESQKIIIDQVEIGRSASCQVRFDETFQTVSRRHAAIVKNGDGWKLVHLSSTNSTLLNGQRVEGEAPLHNGDEIQISVGGPRLGFIVPVGKQSLVSSLRMTERLNLFRKQALRPYKAALSVLGVLVILLAGLGGWNAYENHQTSKELAMACDSLRAMNDTIESQRKLLGIMDGRLTDVNTSLQDIKRTGGRVVVPKPNPSPKPNPDNKLFKYEPDVAFIQILGYDVTLPDGQTVSLQVGDSFEDGTRVTGGTGTGFLMSDGRFVTARHMAEPWLFSFEDDPFQAILNIIATNGGQVSAKLGTYSQNGNMELKSSQARVNRASDKHITADSITFTKASINGTDYAVFSTGRHGSIVPDYALSQSLPISTELSILGFPHGIVDNSVHVSYSEAKVARSGLVNGLIMTTATGFEHGNSGGPVFAKNAAGQFVCIGIVSAGTGRSTGFVVPISRIK